MRAEQKRWNHGTGWQSLRNGMQGGDASLVLVFGGRDRLADPSAFDEVRGMYPNAVIVSASTAGEICGTEVHDDTLSVTAVSFDKSKVQAASTRITDPGQSREAGLRLARQLDPSGLAHVVVLSEGLRVNGDGLARGLRDGVPSSVVVTGGLAGDGARMERTLVGLDAAPQTDNVVAIGFYGDRLRVGYGSLGGWDEFGPERLITRSNGNVLFELDGQPALDLYKSYLGEHAQGLPATGLLFPLALRSPEGKSVLVRTVLAVDEKDKSMTFAGNLPQGNYARLMKANFERLVDGALGAAKGCATSLVGTTPDLALLISCVGRKLVLKQRVEEEVEAVRDVLGSQAVLTGFYSYGEICPQIASAKCELHNQTMTITTFAEV